jgi:hypothetical protein
VRSCKASHQLCDNNSVDYGHRRQDADNDRATEPRTLVLARYTHNENLFGDDGAFMPGHTNMREEVCLMSKVPHPDAPLGEGRLAILIM